MLQPARRKYRKEQKGRNTGIATRGNTVSSAISVQVHRPWAPDGAPDRIRASRHFAPRQARWPHLDPRVPDKPISKNLPRCVWATVKATLSTTWLKSSPAGLYEIVGVPVGWREAFALAAACCRCAPLRCPHDRPVIRRHQMKLLNCATRTWLVCKPRWKDPQKANSTCACKKFHAAAVQQPGS